jgi:hypothetical protein
LCCGYFTACPIVSVSPEEEIATDGSCFKNGYEDATAGAGIFYNEDDPRNQAISIRKSLPWQFTGIASNLPWIGLNIFDLAGYLPSNSAI